MQLKIKTSNLLGFCDISFCCFFLIQYGSHFLCYHISTRIDPGSGNGSVLDLAIVSANIEESVTQFTVDNQRKMTIFAMIKNKNNVVEKKVHRSFYNQSENKSPYENCYQRKEEKNY